MRSLQYQCDSSRITASPLARLHPDFVQLTQSYQAHGGAVNTGTTPQVQYSYANGSSNTIRITGMTYPNGRNVVDDAIAADSLNDVPWGMWRVGW